MRVSSGRRDALFFAISVSLHLAAWLGIAFQFINLNSPVSLQKNIDIQIVESFKATPPPRVIASQQIVQQDKNDSHPPLTKDTKFLSQSDQEVQKNTIAKSAGQFTNSENETEIKAYDQGDLATSASDESQTDDVLNDIEEGLKTTLTTKKFAYYNYYNKLREQVKVYWEPLVETRVKPLLRDGPALWNNGNRVTKLGLIISKQGDLADIAILNSSGLDAADDAAVEAIRRASPFTPPPPELLDAEGYVRMNWDLVVESSN